VVGDWRRLHNEELHNKILVRKPKGKRLLRRLRYKWENNNKMDFGEIGWKFVDEIHLAHNKDQYQALVNTVMDH
jgi:hypothetical protein